MPFLELEILLKNTPCPELIKILSIMFVCMCVKVFSPELSLVLAQYHTCAHELPLVKENSDFQWFTLRGRLWLVGVQEFGQRRIEE